MAIRDKDGSTYRLKGPNPVMDTQESWNRGQIELINMKHDEEETLQDPHDPSEKLRANYDIRDIAEILGLNLPEIAPPGESVSSEEFLEEAADLESPEELIPTPVYEPEPIPEPEPEPIPTPEPDPEPISIPEPDPPSAVTVETDPPVVVKPTETVALDSNKRIVELFERHKVVFHCVPATGTQEIKDDFYGDVRYKTTYGPKQTFNAIIIKEDDFNIQFWTNRKVREKSVVYPRNGSKRWWRVHNVELKEVGFLMHGVPSDVNPSFD